MTSPVLLMLLLAAGSDAADPAATAILPPLPSWSGASEARVVADDHAWITPSEQTGLTATPDYAATMAWLDRLAAADERFRQIDIGASPEGRAIRMVVASAEGAADPAALAANGRPTLLAHGGIHSGEIDGKDAGLMLLRDLRAGGPLADLLDEVNLLFIPILNVDGHERSSPYGRINQRGPATMGWRTNARNLNLNRDFAKLDTVEVRALVDVVNHWQPELYLDLHVTDGVDYQYDITFGYNGSHGWSPAIGAWLERRYRPFVSERLAAAGHIPGPLVFAVNDQDLSGGNVLWTAGPRFSNGWGDARHLPTVLVENHSLKPYRQRVLGTRVLLEASLRLLAEAADGLAQARASDLAQRRDPMPLAWGVDAEAAPATTAFRGIRSTTELSPISGRPVVRWTGEPIDQRIPLLRMDHPRVSVARPNGYLIPPAWNHLVERLRAQGIEVATLQQPRELQVERYRLPDAAVDPAPFEGHVLVRPGSIRSEYATVTAATGSHYVATDQPLGDLAMLLLEPGSPDSYFQWGFLLEILQRTEYVEAYVMEPMARAMLAADPQLRASFEEQLTANTELAADPVARLQWFYQRTPWYDERHGLYPVLRVLGRDEVASQ